MIHLGDITKINGAEIEPVKCCGTGGKGRANKAIDELGEKMFVVNNSEKFKQIFGIYATELWAMPEEEFFKWLSAVEIMPFPREIIQCKDCKHNPKIALVGCPMAGLNERQRPETGE